MPSEGATLFIADTSGIRITVCMTAAVAPERLGDLVGRVTRTEFDEINRALRVALELD